MAQYIDKAAVVAEIKERINRNNENAASYSSSSEHDYLCRVKEAVYKDLLSFLDTLKVKDVDLEKILIGFQNRYTYENSGELPSAIEIAEHFFELGMQAQSDRETR